MDIVESQPIAPPTNARRLRTASLAFHLGTFILVTFPAVNVLLYRPGPQTFWIAYAIGAILLWLWGSVTLARDPHLKILMPFGSRVGRERVAQGQRGKLILDEFDFHLRSEAFRISYQIVATLVSLLAALGALMWSQEIRVEWSLILALVFPFGVLWLLGLPTSIVVWLTEPAQEDRQP